MLGACGNDDQSAANEQDESLQIMTTFYPMYDFTENIVGDEGDVELLVPSGNEPHDYEPSARDIAEITESDAFVYHNENMETWVPEASEGWQENEPAVIEGTEGITLMPGDEEEHDHDHDHGEEGHSHEFDPHTWVSPQMAVKEVESIKDQLVELYPERQEAFETNAENYISQLEDLDDDYTETLESAQQKSFVTQHAAFGYLALDYDLNQVPIAGLSPDQEPSPSRLAELKEYVSDNDINYIYFEENANDKIARTLVDETGVELEVLNPLESLTDEQMDNGEDYISVMEDNLAALEKTTDIAGEEIQPEEGPQEEEHTVYNGYFEDEEVEDRSLSDYAGDWQSVYPLLEDGTLDQVFEYQSKLNQDQSPQEYKEYYETGYQTDVDEIKITDNSINFIVDGENHEYEYEYEGYEILDYEGGNRGVRYNFETQDENAGEYKYVQFSDHSITPTESSHFHIFFGGESQEDLYDQLENWPTYYPEDMTKEEIAQEMMAHE
ncbi:zinc ABC transporter substrate-binding protein AdcA [Tetragenococcus muriaticus]|uniref:zinc ABC transporter substrate-binding protein AdcA n=2 Tax=Tetragenococcus muriaticus TaxID=64642 RepID=UPI00056F3366|nr:zinc ABC transporter substrate-binding protein AdcA [Tetragenococcus muriaticus]